MPATRKAAVFLGPDRIVLDEKPIPEPGSLDALVSGCASNAASDSKPGGTGEGSVRSADYGLNVDRSACTAGALKGITDFNAEIARAAASARQAALRPPTPRHKKSRAGSCPAFYCWPGEGRPAQGPSRPMRDARRLASAREEMPSFR